MPDFLQPLVGNSPRAAVIVYAIIGTAALLALVVLWRVFGYGPRRARGLNRAKRRLAHGAWQDALARVRKLRHLGTPSAAWKKRLDETEAFCLDVGARQALDEKRFEEALDHLLRRAQALGEPESTARTRVQAAILAEIRKVFVTAVGDRKPVHDLIARAMSVQTPCPEASFWQALCFLRGGEPDRALESLHLARGMDEDGKLKGEPNKTSDSSSILQPSSFVDPPLYLGALLLRQGQAKESLKHLTEANRLGGNCPVATLQLGCAMIAAGGDTQLAVRALQRGLGAQGLALWNGEPTKVWVEGFPDGKSYVRKLAAVHPFVCPLWGADLTILTRQGNLALAQGLYKLAAFAEAAELYAKALRETAPSLVVLRGLGYSLARLGKYDDAFKHLRIAHEMEEPKERATAGYLALCGGMGTPTRPEDKARNIGWALALVTHFSAPGDREWVSLISTLFAHARHENVELSKDDQVYLCEHLSSVHETDAPAAEAYHQLQATYPLSVHPEYAWLYCRAAEQHGATGPHALELIERAFADPQAARAFFEERRWDWSAVEFAFLERAAAFAPGQFPRALGADYPVRGRAMLLERSLEQERAGALDNARATAEVLHKLDPDDPRALDRLAYLHFRSGHLDDATSLLQAWHVRHPRDPIPAVRLAILQYQRGMTREAMERIREAFLLSEDGRRAPIAFLGARLALRSALMSDAEQFLRQCLEIDSGHADALWCLAAVLWLRGDQTGLAHHVELMQRAASANARLHYFTGLCQLAAEDYPGVLRSCTQIAATESVDAALKNGTTESMRIQWPVEAEYLAGLAHLGAGEDAAASTALEKTAGNGTSPSANYARALLGSVAFAHQHYDKATKWWQALDQEMRSTWKLGDTLAGTVFMTALAAYANGAFEQAADTLRAAGKLGCRDRRLGPLLVTALFKAGQTAAYSRSAKGEE